jgi:hypothetical protein
MHITDNGISQLTALSGIHIRFVSGVTNHGLSCLVHLTVICISYNDKVTNELFSYLPNLKAVEVTKCALIDSEAFSYMPQITELVWKLCSFDENNLRYLPNLARLILQLNWQKLRKLYHGKLLRELILAGSLISDEKIFCRLINLHRLVLIHCKGTISETLPKNTQQLCLHKCNDMEDHHLVYASHIPNIRIVGCHKITNKGIGELTNVRTLTLLDLPNVTNECCDNLSTIRKSMIIDCTKK